MDLRPIRFSRILHYLRKTESLGDSQGRETHMYRDNTVSEADAVSPIPLTPVTPFSASQYLNGSMYRFVVRNFQSCSRIFAYTEIMSCLNSQPAARQFKTVLTRVLLCSGTGDPVRTVPHSVSAESCQNRQLCYRKQRFSIGKQWL